MVSMRRTVLLVAFALAAGTLQTRPEGRGLQSTGVIYGRVDIRRTLPALARRPAISELGTPPPHGAVDRTQAVVYLETSGARAFDRGQPQRVTMDQREETFSPRVLAITVGSTVDFRNSDHTYHNVFSLSKVRRFDLGRYATGRSKAVRFDRPGVVRVFCEIHSHMSAFILVFGHRYFAATDADGAYRLRAVPAGRHTLILWHEGAERESRLVTVSQGGAAEVDFSVQ